MKFSLRPVTVPMRAPFAAGHGSVSARELLLVKLTDGERSGYGEAAPLASYDGVGLDDVRAALEDCRPTLAAATNADLLERDTRTALLAECGRRAVLPQALAAVDLAVFDFAGRARGEPVWKILGATAPSPIVVNWTIAAPDRAGAAREAQLARKAGYGTAKLKVGTGDDAGRLAATRASGGPELAIRLDANGAWEPAEAVRWLEVLAPAGIELCEEPVAGLEAIEQVAAASAVPVAIDESAADPGALARRCCQAICLKIGRCGGITGLLAAAGQARRLGYEVYLASTLDGPLGIAAALHAAAAIAPDRACGLATLRLFDRRPDPLPASAGAIAVPTGPGLGHRLEAWYG